MSALIQAKAEKPRKLSSRGTPSTGRPWNIRHCGGQNSTIVVLLYFLPVAEGTVGRQISHTFSDDCGSLRRNKAMKKRTSVRVGA